MQEREIFDLGNIFLLGFSENLRFFQLKISDAKQQNKGCVTQCQCGIQRKKRLKKAKEGCAELFTLWQEAMGGG